MFVTSAYGFVPVGTVVVHVAATRLWSSVAAPRPWSGRDVVGFVAGVTAVALAAGTAVAIAGEPARVDATIAAVVQAPPTTTIDRRQGGTLRVLIVVAYMQRYRYGHEYDFVPPITGIHLAALTPRPHQVVVVHQQVENVDLEDPADLVAISFFSGFAPEAFRLAEEFRRRGRRVIAGGPHATFCAEECLQYFDAVVTGEAESVWPAVLQDASLGRLQRTYRGSPLMMEGLPTPRYDLLPDRYFIKKVIQATRGCPFTCSFCTVPTLNPGFRLRPVDEVLRDIAYDDFPHWWQRKVVWFWDDNLTIRRAWAKELLTAMIPLKRWWLTQASLDIARDEGLLDLMQASGCIGIFFGIESFDLGSLADANKRQNQVRNYRKAIDALHERGIAVMAGFIAGFDHDTPDGIVAMADQLLEVGVDVPFLSILTPFRGTPLRSRLEVEGRILEDRGWEHYNGYNVAHRPALMTPDELLSAHRELWRRAFPQVTSSAVLPGSGRG